jgi:hypothetical protein
VKRKKEIKAGDKCYVMHYDPIRMDKNRQPLKEIKEQSITKVTKKYVYTDSSNRFYRENLCGTEYCYYLFFTLEEIDEFFEKKNMRRYIEKFNWSEYEQSVGLEFYEQITDILKFIERECES